MKVEKALKRVLALAVQAVAEEKEANAKLSKPKPCSQWHDDVEAIAVVTLLHPTHKGSKRVHATRKMESRDVWGEHPTYQRSDWRQEVSGNDTNLGYWDWVVQQIEAGGVSK